MGSIAGVWSTIWNGIIAGLNWLLQGLYRLTGNYGIAIILLTIVVKLILLPLTMKQTRSMMAMQKIQPEIRKLQEKYKDDKERLSQEMMKFYKENKVNPLGGCLPLLLQLPIFIALYTVLRKYLTTPPVLLLGRIFQSGLPNPQALAVKGSLIQSASFLGISNLADTARAAGAAGYVLIGLLALTTWYSQKQVMTDPRQKSMLYIMPLIMAFIAISLPSGVGLYWLTTNVLQILQQYLVERYEKKREAEEEAERARAKKEAKRAGRAAEPKAALTKTPPKTPAKAKGAVTQEKKGAPSKKQVAGGEKGARAKKPAAGGKKASAKKTARPLPKQPPAGRRRPPPKKK